MKAYESIEQLAEEMEVSERTAWRWLKQGRIKKKRSEDGRIIFVLVDEPTDITDTDDTDMSATDVGDMSPSDTQPISDVSTRRVDRKLSVRPGSGSLVQSLRDELEASKVSFELEKLEAEKKRWEERRDRERLEKAEQERIQRLEEHQTSEQQRREEQRTGRIRNIKQKIKDQIFSSTWVNFLSPQYRSKLIIEIERALSQVDVEELPEDELFCVAQGAAERVKEEVQRERDRVNQERQEQANKETREVAETILEAVKLGAGMS